MAAETYTERHWFTGKLKLRCRQDGKVVYPDEAEATLRAQQISERTPMYPYLGKCGHWHVSRTLRKRRA